MGNLNYVGGQREFLLRFPPQQCRTSSLPVNPVFSPNICLFRGKLTRMTLRMVNGIMIQKTTEIKLTCVLLSLRSNFFLFHSRRNTCVLVSMITCFLGSVGHISWLKLNYISK